MALMRFAVTIRGPGLQGVKWCAAGGYGAGFAGPVFAAAYVPFPVFTTLARGEFRAVRETL